MKLETNLVIGERLILIVGEFGLLALQENGGTLGITEIGCHTHTPRPHRPGGLDGRVDSGRVWA